MDGHSRVRSLGMGWLLALRAEAWSALEDQALWIGFGTAVTVALLLVIPATPTGILILTPVLVLALGTLSWASRRSTDATAPPLPVTRLILLAVVLLLMQAPVLMTMAFGGLLLSLMAMGTFAVLAAATSPTISMVLSFVAFASFYGGFVLAFCFAPHLIAAHGLGVPQSLWQSLRIWGRNPIAFLVFAALGLLWAAWRVFPLWALIPFLPSGLTMMISTAIWAAGGLMLAAALVGFARAAWYSED